MTGGILRRVALVLSAVVFATSAAPPPSPSALMVGAARVDITPALADLVPPFTSVAHPVHVRAVVVDSGGKRAVIVIADVPTIGAAVADTIVRRIAAEARVSRAQVVLGTTHTHNVMRVDTNAVGIMLPGSPKYVAQVTAAAVAAVRDAVTARRPARVGVGKGRAHFVGNRNVWSAAHGRYISAVDRSGREPIDETLGVVAFEDLAGKPIAYLLNYAIEPIIAMAMKSEISGDVPGVATRTIEERRPGAVALFTVGAAGIPLYRADDTPAPQRRAHAIALLEAYGTLLAEEALAVADATATSADGVRIGSAAEPLVCPGKATTPFNLPERCAYTSGSSLPACEFKDRDIAPVTLNVGALSIGDWTIVQTDANISPIVGARMLQGTPVANTWIVALTFGPMRFVVDDAAYALNTYEATATAAKKGCAEQGYLDRASRLIAASRRASS